MKCQKCGRKIGKFGGVAVKRFDEFGVWLRPIEIDETPPKNIYGIYHYKCLSKLPQQ